MDFITHSLIGAGAVRLFIPRRQLLGQLSLAALLGSLLPDADSWLALLGPEMYGLHHRQWTHSAVGLTAIAFIASGAARAFGGVAQWRRIGWFVSPNLSPVDLVPRAPYALLLAAAASGAALHWVFDVITGFGNMELFWPWSQHDFSLHAVSSFDAVIFGSTLCWHVAVRRLDWPRGREVILTASWALAMALYIAARYLWAKPSII